jgi:hypothetical protein
MGWSGSRREELILRNPCFSPQSWAPLLFGALIGSVGCSTQDGSLQRANVVLIVVDALRADHLGIYGYDRPTSPFIALSTIPPVEDREGLATPPRPTNPLLLKQLQALGYID